MAPVVLGVDGGSTKTHCAVFDLDGNRLDLLQCGPTNHEVLPGSFSELAVKLQEMVRIILGRNRLSLRDVQYSVWGLSGVDTRRQQQKITQIIRQLGLPHFILCNDAYLGVKAGTSTGFGVGAVNGTGCTICGIDPTGKRLQLNGQGAFTGEPGGGGYLGSRATQVTYNYLFRGGPATQIQKILFEMFDVSSKFDFIDTMREQMTAQQLRVADLAPVVFTAANAGDAVALAILESMGREIALSINGVIQELNFDPQQPLDVILSGSVHVKGANPTAVNWLKKTVTAANPDRRIRFTLLQRAPVLGAICWALHEVRKDNALYCKVMAE